LFYAILFQKDHVIDIHENYRKQTFKNRRTLKAAYGSSPFYEFYIDDLMEIWDNPSKTLYENNLRCHQIICRIMDWDLPLIFSESYIPSNNRDFRPYFSKEKLDVHYPSYRQVFSDKIDFMANMSILDLIFNLGPESTAYLKKLNIPE